MPFLPLFGGNSILPGGGGGGEGPPTPPQPPPPDGGISFDGSGLTLQQKLAVAALKACKTCCPQGSGSGEEEGSGSGSPHDVPILCCCEYPIIGYDEDENPIYGDECIRKYSRNLCLTVTGGFYAGDYTLTYRTSPYTPPVNWRDTMLPGMINCYQTYYFGLPPRPCDNALYDDWDKFLCIASWNATSGILGNCEIPSECLTMGRLATDRCLPTSVNRFSDAPHGIEIVNAYCSEQFMFECGSTCVFCVGSATWKRRRKRFYVNFVFYPETCSLLRFLVEEYYSEDGTTWNPKYQLCAQELSNDMDSCEPLLKVVSDQEYKCCDSDTVGNDCGGVTVACEPSFPDNTDFFDLVLTEC